MQQKKYQFHCEHSTLAAKKSHERRSPTCSYIYYILGGLTVVERGAIAMGIEDWFGRLLERSDWGCC